MHQISIGSLSASTKDNKVQLFNSLVNESLGVKTDVKVFIYFV